MDKFEALGHFWLPEHKDDPLKYMTGHLTFDPQNGAHIRLKINPAYALQSKLQCEFGIPIQKIPIIQGLADGKCFTLQDLLLVKAGHSGSYPRAIL